MGLAATQARLLFITARQNDVSAKMQRISNANMVLARDEDDIMTKYNQMANATKRVPIDGVDVSYNALMGPAAAVNDKIAIITDADGHVVLNEQLAKALDLDDTGTVEPEKAIEVLESLNPAIKSAEDIEKRMAELVAPIEGKRPEDIQKRAEAEKAAAGFIKQYGDYPSEVRQFKSLAVLLEDMNSIGADEGKWNSANKCGFPALDNLLSLILEDQTIMLADDGDHGGVPFAQAQNNIKELSKAIIGKIADALGINSEVMKESLETWIEQMAASINFSDRHRHNSESTAKEKAQDDAKKALVGNGTDTGNFLFMKGSDHDFFYINVSELTRRILGKVGSMYARNDLGSQTSTDVQASSKKIDISSTKWSLRYNENGYCAEAWEDKLQNAWNEYSNVISYDEFKEYALKGKADSDKNAKDGTSTTKSGYYKQLYDSLVTKGWTVHDSSTMGDINELIQNGTYKVGQLAKDIRYCDDLYEVVPDEEERDKAEAYYNQEMKKINRKEKQLDNELTKLNTEYSALSNDYNSVKGILEANIQRSFTYCQTG